MTIKEMNDRAREFTSCKFVFEGRASNVENHSLAKFSFSLHVGRHMRLGSPQ